MSNSLQGLVDSVVAATAGLPEPSTLARWSPELSGNIDIVIRRDGRWLHEGRPIQREGLVRLFASLLRREDDGEYYLVTPVEKWRISVENHALLGIDCDRDTSDGDTWFVLLNTGGRCRIGGKHRLHAIDVPEPYVDLPNGLTAQLTRAAWYRLIDHANMEGDRAYLRSGDELIDLGSTH